ncbi:MAG: cytochrome c oxidase subunit II [Pirellulaceae bacterium]|nr:cytochrome c oxidase subunit II [Pirellulaceae bacterium]
MIDRLTQASRLVTLACGLALGLSLPGDAVAQRQEAAPQVLTEVGIDEQLGGQIPLGLRFRDENGREVTLASLFPGDRPAVLSLNYSDCPMLCTLVLNGLIDGLQELSWTPGREFDVISVSIDPLETPQRARLTKQRYLRDYGRPETAAGWHFLTGTQENIKRLAEAVGFRYKYVEKDKQYAHAAVIMICTPQGRMSRYLYGVQFPEQTLRLSLVEAGEGKVGSTMDRVLLFCFHYDAEAGRYGPVARNLMKLGAGMTCMVVLLTLIPYWLRRRSHAAHLGAASSPPAGDQSPPESGPLAGFALPLVGLLGAPGGSVFFPQRASTDAVVVDEIFYFIFLISVIFFVLILGLMVVFVFKFRRREGEGPQPSASHSTSLEMVWTIIPTILVAVMFIWGFWGYMGMRQAPDNSYEIQVLAKKWAWSFVYPNGHIEPDLHVPVDRPIRLVMSSDDVIHSLFIPAFRLKMDVVPGRFTKTWFHATETGEHQLFCAEYCGTQHSTMLAKVVVHPSGEFEKWLEDAANFLERMTPVEGGALLVQRRGCAQCHSVDGSAKVGPSFKGTFGTQQPVEPVAAGENITVDENYIRESIMEPMAKIRAGYKPVMPTYKGQLKDEEIAAIIAYIKSLK